MAKVIWIDFTPDETLEEASAYWEECMANNRKGSNEPEDM